MKCKTLFNVGKWNDLEINSLHRLAKFYDNVSQRQAQISLYSKEMQLEQGVLVRLKTEQQAVGREFASRLQGGSNVL